MTSRLSGANYQVVGTWELTLPFILPVLSNLAAAVTNTHEKQLKGRNWLFGPLVLVARPWFPWLWASWGEMESCWWESVAGITNVREGRSHSETRMGEVLDAPRTFPRKWLPVARPHFLNFWPPHQPGTYLSVYKPLEEILYTQILTFLLFISIPKMTSRYSGSDTYPIIKKASFQMKSAQRQAKLCAGV